MLRDSGLSVLVGVASLLMPSLVCGQSWGDILKDAANRRATQMAEEAIDKGLDAAEDAVRCVVTDQTCIDQAQKDGKEVVVTNKKGKPLPPEQQHKSASAAKTNQSGTSGFSNAWNTAPGF